jgi:hypothetical protein
LFSRNLGVGSIAQEKKWQGAVVQTSGMFHFWFYFAVADALLRFLAWSFTDDLRLSDMIHHLSDVFKRSSYCPALRAYAHFHRLTDF